MIRPEWLDDEPLEKAQRSLNDLVRINRYLGGHGVFRKTLARLVPDRQERFSVLDVGAASGDMGDVIRKVYSNAQITSLDYRVDHLLRTRAPKLVADAFQMPLADGSFDFAYSSLFLHHFENGKVVELLKGFRRVARRAVVITDLERHPLAYYFLPATKWLFGWDRITLHDGPISVEAAFTAEELKSLAESAGLRNVSVRVHRPAFRLAMVGWV